MPHAAAVAPAVDEHAVVEPLAEPRAHELAVDLRADDERVARADGRARAGADAELRADGRPDVHALPDARPDADAGAVGRADARADTAMPNTKAPTKFVRPVKLWTISLASTLNIGMGIVVFISVVIHCAASVFRIKPLIPQEFVA